MKKKIAILLLTFLAVVKAQIPSLGFCPDYVPMTDFDMEKFAGIWYEAERYFQLTEVVSRCVMSNYTKGSDGKFRVSNEVTSRLTGIKRILEGEIRFSAKRDEGKLIVKYTSVPLITPETSYSILDTDYDNYAVLWSCAGIGPLHTQNAWIMTRERLAPGEVLQKAYAVLDKYKISKLYFVKTNQEDCAYLDSLPTPPKKPVKKPTPPQPAVADEEEQNDEPEREAEPLRTHVITPDAPEIINTIQAEIHAETIIPQEAIRNTEELVPEVPVAAPVEDIKTVPEVIMQIAEQVNEEPVAKSAVKVSEEPKEIPVKLPEVQTIPEQVVPSSEIEPVQV